jgi:hypothetical protein
MERRIFLRNALLGGAGLAGLSALKSCDVEPILEHCESNHYGSVLVKNNTGYKIYTDVTWGSYNTNDERVLYVGGQTKYNEVKSGSIEIWVSFDGNDWSYNYENLSDCEDLTYTWYLSARKSANDCPFYGIDPEGNKVIPTRKQKNN